MIYWVRKRSACSCRQQSTSGNAMHAMARERAASSQWLYRDVQAAVKGFKKVICFESSPVNHEATKAAAKEQEVRSRMWHLSSARCSVSNDNAAMPIVAAHLLY